MKKTRRVRRSEDVLTAMTYQLDACLTEAQLEAMVVSDDNGLCVASAGRPDTCEELAARLPIIGRNAPDFGGILLSGAGGMKMVVRTFSVDGQPLYMCALGKPHAKLERTMKRSIKGVSRILAAAA
jgi:hypothetical protein